MSDPNASEWAELLMHIGAQWDRSGLDMPEEVLVIEWPVTVDRHKEWWFLGIHLPDSSPCKYTPAFYGASLHNVVEQALEWMKEH